MDYSMGFALTFKYIFYYDFISIFFIGIPYMMHDGKINMDWKKLQQKLQPTNNYGLLSD
jgi:uncharacterized membrane protein (Fun14 family)